MANTTQPTVQSAAAFCAAVEHPVRRADGLDLLARMARITGTEAVMWGPTLVGFGHRHYVYDSGREGDWFIVGFSPRKAQLVVYGLLDALGDDLGALGKCKPGKDCLYINKLSDIDLDVLDAAIDKAWRTGS